MIRWTGLAQVNQWEVFDAYVEDIEKQRLTKEKSGQQVPNSMSCCYRGTSLIRNIHPPLGPP